MFKTSFRLFLFHQEGMPNLIIQKVIPQMIQTVKLLEMMEKTWSLALKTCQVRVMHLKLQVLNLIETSISDFVQEFLLLSM